VTTGAPAGIDPRPRDYRFVLPPDWWRIGLDDTVRARDVDRLVRHQFAGLDDQPLARRNVTAELLRRADLAASSGGIDLYLSMMRRADVVVPASLLVTYTPPPDGGVPDLASLADVLAVSETAQVRTSEVAQAGTGPAIRRLAYVIEETEVGDGPPLQTPSVALDWHLPVPAGEGALLTLSFASPLVVLEDSLVELFDTIVATTTWVW